MSAHVDISDILICHFELPPDQQSDTDHRKRHSVQKSKHVINVRKGLEKKQMLSCKITEMLLILGVLYKTPADVF